MVASVSTITDVEILVHTTAPSHGKDDAKYRAIAQAYLDFQPTSRQKVKVEFKSTIAPVRAQNKGVHHSEKEPQGLSVSERESAASYQPDTEMETDIFDLRLAPKTNDVRYTVAEQFMSSPRLSFVSVLDNRDSPSFQHTVTRQGDCFQTFPSPSSVIVDSQPEVDQGESKDMLSPTRALQLYLRYNAESQSQFASDCLSQDKDIVLAQSPPALQNNPNSSCQILQSSTQKSSQVRDPGNPLKRKWAEASSESTQVTSFAAVKSDVTDSDFHSTTRSAKQRDRQLSKPLGFEKEGFSYPEPSSRPNMSVNSVSIRQSSWLQVDEIRPCPPETGNEPLTTESLITKDLHEVARRMSLQLTYCPEEQVRPLRPMERGYWLVDYKQWSEELRARCWDCLGRFVTNGSLGWGVWCVRDVDSQTFRVYSWGAIVGHIYLVLHVASEGRIKGTGPCWIGADVKPLIKMEP